MKVNNVIHPMAHLMAMKCNRSLSEERNEYRALLERLLDGDIDARNDAIQALDSWKEFHDGD